MPHKLPRLSQMLFPTLLSMGRGVKIKPSGISLQKTFSGLRLDLNSMHAYADFLGSVNRAPLSYLYCLAQRAQIAVMLDKDFSIALPGMVHLENILEEKPPWSPNKAFDIEVNIEVEPKSEGALIPRCEVHFFQENQKVVSCSSVYMARRKGKQAGKKKEKQALVFPEAILSQQWDIAGNTGKKYAKVSGDSNPIHTHGFFAKLMGFKRPIAHGWYSVAKAVIEAETHLQKPVSYIEVAFKSPVFLPSQQKFALFEKEETTGFTLHNSEGKLVLYGSLA
ncbi:MAG: MaoC family dehydratase [Bacteroidia bacterium]|nr:MaoC family dehydratase [Bacteroidia bacterium]